MVLGLTRTHTVNTSKMHESAKEKKKRQMRGQSHMEVKQCLKYVRFTEVYETTDGYCKTQEAAFKSNRGHETACSSFLEFTDFLNLGILQKKCHGTQQVGNNHLPSGCMIRTLHMPCGKMHVLTAPCSKITSPEKLV